MNKPLRPGDIVLPGKAWHWIVGIPIGLIFLLILALTFSDPPDTRSLQEMSSEEIAQAKEKLKQEAASAPKPVAVPVSKERDAVRGMADFMVKDDNIIGLRMWAGSIGVSAPDFVSAASIRAEISKATNDFEPYRDPNEVLKLMRVLADQDAMFLEVLNESLK